MQFAVGDRRAAYIGARIREFRTHSKRTLHELAAAAGIHANTLSNLERAQVRTEPQEATLLKIADALGCSLDELCGSAPVQPPAEQSVIAFLHAYRDQQPQKFANWTNEMWLRYEALATRFAVSNDAAAAHWASRVSLEFEAIEQLRDLFEATAELKAVGVLRREHARLRKAMKANSNGRVDPAHELPSAHHPESLAAV